MAMSGEHSSSIAGVAFAILGLAIIAVLVSKSAQSGTVATSGGSAIARIICTALSPVTGGSACSNILTSVTSSISYGGIVP